MEKLILKRDANDVAAEEGIDALRDQTDALSDAAMQAAIDEYPTVTQLIQRYGYELEKPVIHGLLREGEIMTINAPPKSGKTWLEYHIALCIASGGYFMNVENWKCESGPVMIFDNELSERTSGYRIPKVCESMKLDVGWCERIRVKNFRGNIPDIDEMQRHFTAIRPLQPKLIILDALYRFLPEDSDENSNSYMTKVYNKLDKMLSGMPGAALLIVHHTSKGNQADKGVVDVGSGASAGNRASDNVVAIREHEEDNTYVFEAKPRTWESPPAIACRWDFPLWQFCDADPTKLKGRKVPKDAKKSAAPRGDDDAAFMTALCIEWQSRGKVEAELIEKLGIKAAHSKNFINDMISRYNLFDIAIGVVQDCKTFEAKRERYGLQFRLKG